MCVCVYVNESCAHLTPPDLCAQHRPDKVKAAQVGLQAQLAAQQAHNMVAQVPEWKRKLLEKKIAKDQPALSVALASQHEADKVREAPVGEVQQRNNDAKSRKK